MCSSLESNKMDIPSYLEYVPPLIASLAEEPAFIILESISSDCQSDMNSDIAKMSQNTNSNKIPTKNVTKYITSIVSL